MEKYMKLTKTQIRAMLLKYDTKKVGFKMLRDLKNATPQEIGRAILSTKKASQTVLNLERQ